MDVAAGDRLVPSRVLPHTMVPHLVDCATRWEGAKVGQQNLLLTADVRLQHLGHEPIDGTAAGSNGLQYFGALFAAIQRFLNPGDLALDSPDAV